MGEATVSYDSADFDHFVAVLISRWEEQVDQYVRRWSEMDPDEQFDHAIDFDVNSTHFGHLQEYVETHELTAEQRAQYEHLLALMEKNRPKLKELGFWV